MTFLIQTQGPETPETDILKGYEIFRKRGVDMPDPLKLMTASPGYFSIMLQRNLYYANHPNLSFALLAHIRYFIASRLDYTFCTIFNQDQLMKMGMTQADFSTMGNDPEKSLLEKRERDLLSFVVRAVDDPEQTTGRDLDSLRAEGWTDGDIFDALAQGVGMIDHNIFMRVFSPSNP